MPSACGVWYASFVVTLLAAARWQKADTGSTLGSTAETECGNGFAVSEVATVAPPGIGLKPLT